MRTRTTTCGHDLSQGAITDRGEDLPGRLFDAELFDPAQFGRKIELLQSLRKSYDVDKFVREDVEQHRFEVEFGWIVSAPGYAQDAMILQTNAVQVMLLNHFCTDTFDAVIA